MLSFGFNNLYKFRSAFDAQGGINDKLNQANCTLEDILNEDEVCQAIKMKNSRLLQFLIVERIKRLIDYITVVPVGDDELIGHRYPFYACEILSLDESSINDLFTLKHEELQQKAQSTTESTTNPLLSNDKAIQLDEETKDKGEEIDIIDINADEGINHEPALKKDTSTLTNSLNSNNLVLFDQLLKFLDDDKELNYVLAGYFSKVILYLLNKYPTKLISYLYIEQQAYFEKIILHSDMKAFGDIALKLLSLDSLSATGDYTIIKITSTCSNSINSTQITSSTLKQIRNQMLSNLFCQIDIGKADFELDNLLNLCVDLIQSKELLLEFISNQSILTHLFKSLQRKAEETPIVKQNYSFLLVFLIQLLKFIQVHKIVLPSNSSVDNIVSLDPDDINHTPLSKIILVNLRGILRNFDDINSQTLQSQTGSIKSLGVVSLRILELIKHLFYYFGEVPYLLDEILIRESFFKKAIDFFFKYQWNNLFHQHFINLFKLYIDKEKKHPDISKHLFSDLNFGNVLMEKLLNDKFIFQSTGIVINCGYYSHLVYLCSKINVYTDEIGSVNRSRLGSFNFVASSGKPLELQQNVNEPMIGVNTIENLHVEGRRSIKECIEIKNSLSSDWNQKFKENVQPLIQVYESRLCNAKSVTQDNEHDENINDFEFAQMKEKSEDNSKAENNSSDGTSGETTLFEEKVEESFNLQPSSDVFPVIESKVIVDELDSKNFTDLFYWKSNMLNDKLALEALEDLNIN